MRWLSGIAVVLALLGFVSSASAQKAEKPAAPAAEKPAPSDHDKGDKDHAGHDHDKEHGEHEHIGHANAGPKLNDPTEFRSDLALFTLVVFAVMLAILWKFAWGPISAGLDSREKRIFEHIATAQRSHDDAKKMLAEYEQKLAGAAVEVRAIIEEARRDAEHTKSEIVTEGKRAADAERARALREIETATDAAMKTIAERAAGLAVELAGKILKHEIKQADHAKLISESVAQLGNSPSRN